jgi:hypothetical protein
MNRLLASALNVVNVVFAFSILAGGALLLFASVGGDPGALGRALPAGATVAAWTESPAARAGLIVVATVMVAGYACGLVAYLALIESHLRALRQATDRGDYRPERAPASRRSPRRPRPEFPRQDEED